MQRELKFVGQKPPNRNHFLNKQRPNGSMMTFLDYPSRSVRALFCSALELSKPSHSCSGGVGPKCSSRRGSSGEEPSEAGNVLSASFALPTSTVGKHAFCSISLGIKLKN